MASDKYTYYFKLKEEPRVPVEARNLKPDTIAGLSIDETRRIPVRLGNKKLVIEDLFEVDGPTRAPANPESIELHITGRGSGRIRYLGCKMSSGRIVVHGDIGLMTGYKMSGGAIIVKGDAGSWLGAKMKNGYIEVHGCVGDFVGSKLQGEKPGKGMKGGLIIVHGDAGSYVGTGMKGGSIIIEGCAGNLVGSHMCGGSILVCGGVGRFTGARMVSGKIVVDGVVDGVLPSFYIDSITSKAKVKNRVIEKEFMLFIGDVLVGGRGKLYIAYDVNVDKLSMYRELLMEAEI